MAFELYAKVEHLLGIEAATEELHGYFLSLLQEAHPKTLLDVGCGRGAFLKACKKQGIHAAGIDASRTMIEAAKKAGLSVSHQDISQTAGSFEAITAIFDVLNFVPPSQLAAFFGHVERLLARDGVFIADINTHYGFAEVAEGVLVHDDESQSLIIQAAFENEILTTDFAYFSRTSDDTYTKETDTIVQYFHTIEALIEATKLTLHMEMPIELYGEAPDKAILVFKKDT